MLALDAHTCDFVASSVLSMEEVATKAYRVTRRLRHAHINICFAAIFIDKHIHVQVAHGD